MTVAKAKFSEEPLFYKVPDGLMYPLLASFRALIGYDKDANKYYWKKILSMYIKNARKLSYKNYEIY